SATTGNAWTISPSEVTLTIRTRFIEDLLVVRKSHHFSRRFKYSQSSHVESHSSSRYGALHTARRARDSDGFQNTFIQMRGYSAM
ncbi:MAG TPA: hypothetical protein VGM85_18780, partial [Paraburkholderia sp.]